MKALNLLWLAGIVFLIQSTTSTALGQAAGNWDGGAYGSFTLSQSGSTVTGSYPYSNGRYYGTMSGSTLTAIWVQDNSGNRCSKPAQDGRYYWGKISFTFSGNSFSGAWGYCDAAPDHQVQGKRVGSAPPSSVPASNAPAAPTGNNLALHKPTRMSSQLAPGYEASLCVDGIGKGLCHTGREANPWWQVDLGRVYALGQIVVYNRTTECCWERERSLVALISSDGGSWQQIYNNNGKDFQVLQIPATGYSARFVRLQLHATDWMNLAQVAVYDTGDTGHPVQNAPSTGKIPIVSTPKTNQPTLPVSGSSGSQPPSAPMPANATKLSHPTNLPTVGNRRNVSFTDWVVLNANNEVIKGITTGDVYNTIGDYGGVPFTGLISYNASSGLVEMGVLGIDYGGFGVVGTHQQITLKGRTKAFFTPGAGPGKGGVMQGVLARGDTFNRASTGYSTTVPAGYFVSFDESGKLLTSRPAQPTD